MLHLELEVAIAANLIILMDPPKEEKSRKNHRKGKSAVVKLALSAKKIMIGIIIPNKTWIIVTHANANGDDEENRLKRYEKEMAEYP